MIIGSSHSASKAMSAHVADTCILLSSYSTELAGALIDSMPHRQDWPDGLKSIVALLCVVDIEAKKRTFEVCDAFIGGGQPAPTGTRLGEVMAHLQAHRIVRWEDELGALIDAKKITVAQAKKALDRRLDVAAHLASKTAQN